MVGCSEKMSGFNEGNFSDLFNVSLGISSAPIYIKVFVTVYIAAAVTGTIGNLAVIKFYGKFNWKFICSNISR